MTEVWTLFLGRFHPLLLHLPIGVLVVVVTLEILPLRGYREGFLSVRRVLLLLGLVFAIITSATGYLLSQEGGYNEQTLSQHQWLGIGMTVVLALSTLVAWSGPMVGRRLQVYRASLGLCIILLTLGSHQGAIMTHGRDYLTEHWPFGREATAAEEGWEEIEAPFSTTAGLSFGLEIWPIIEAKCVECHGPDKTKGGLRMDSLDHLLAGGDGGPVVVAGDPERSPMYVRTTLHPSHDDFMPPKGEGLTDEERNLLRMWIAEGAGQNPVPASAEPVFTVMPESEPVAYDAKPSLPADGEDLETPIVAAEFGRDWIVPVAGVDLVWLEPGSFVMGSPEGEQGRSAVERQHQVTLTQGFWLGRFEVTQSEWARVMGSGPEELKDESNKSWPMYATGPNLPMYYVSRQDAKDFCEVLTSQEREAGRIPAGYEFTIPSEAQWEYACRAGTRGSYAGESLEAMGWYQENSDGSVQPVGLKEPNPWGFFDMHGNLWEWCFDTDLQYPPEDTVDPVKVFWTSNKVCRGGSWRSTAEDCRSAHRFAARHSGRNGGIGFRLALAPAMQEWSRETHGQNLIEDDD